jgi:hypothetical protein
MYFEKGLNRLDQRPEPILVVRIYLLPKGHSTVVLGKVVRRIQDQQINKTKGEMRSCVEEILVDDLVFNLAVVDWGCNGYQALAQDRRFFLGTSNSSIPWSAFLHRILTLTDMAHPLSNSACSLTMPRNVSSRNKVVPSSHINAG